MMKGLMLALMVGGLVSCGTSKTVQTEQHTDYTNDFNRVEHMISDLKADMVQSSRSFSDKLSDMKVNHTTIVLSSPDSTGQQHPTHITTTVVDRQDKESVHTEENASLKIDCLSQKIDSLNQVLNAVLSERNEVEQVSKWDYIKLSALLGLLIAACLTCYKFFLRS